MARCISKRKGNLEDVLLCVPIWTFSVVTVSLPALSLAICFFSAFLFRFEDVNETMCDVKNYLPSVSAVTGIAPQTYLWRTSIALHSAPRFAVAIIYFNHHMSRLNYVSPNRRPLFKVLVHLNFWLNTIEDSCLVLVAYISNRENYPVHEKIFVVFMVASICYILLNTILYKWTRSEKMSDLELKSYWWKKAMLVSNCAATIGLIFFFIQHRLFCVVGAFSLFSACEYIIAYTNMGYHFTGFWDFKGKYFTFGNFSSDESSMNGAAPSTTNNNKLKQKHQ